MAICIDVKQAHKRCRIRDSEQGLLGFTWQNALYFFRCCPFGAVFSQHWWGRVGGCTLRLLHTLLFLAHVGLLFVDDFIFSQAVADVEVFADASEFEAAGIPFGNDLAKEIASCEALAQAGLNKMFSTKFPLGLVLEHIALLAAMHRISIDVSHVPGAKNCKADALSRPAESPHLQTAFRASAYALGSLLSGSLVLRDETHEALTALHERADLLLENQFSLQTQFLILQQRITRLEGTPECTDGAVAPARAKAANDQGGVGEFTFPPSPPLGVSDLAGYVPLPQVFPGCGESSEGSFSRVSFGSECVENDLHFPPLEFPEDWEDDAPETATARTPMDLESVERTASASAAPCEQAASSIPDLDQAMSMSIAHADASADISLAASGEFVSTAGVADDALGSFVGGLVKQDVARFGRLDDGLKLPWESVSKLLFDPDCVWDPLQGRKQDSIFPPVTHNAQAAHRPPAGPKEAPSGSIFARAIALGAAARDPAAERERKREQGIGMWSRLVMRYSECCSLYECVSQGLSGREAGYEDVLVAVSAAVGVKSPHTIHKRAASFWTFVRWLDVHEPLAPSRLHEVQVWNFVQFLKETSAPASKAASVLSAFRFAHFVLGFRLSGIVDSKRIAGATEQQLVNVRKLRQAKDLTVSQVLELHARLTARLVFEVSQHKGARKVQLKTKLLPILVPMIGVHGKCWIDEALTAFRNAGRSLTSLAPADESGVVSSRRSIASAEVGKMFRAFLGLPEEVTDPSAPRVTAYSLRGTCLGWGGKFGFDEDLKSILGRHASSVKTTQAIYSRELSAAPVRRLQDMIREVASGNFFPDNSRSSYFPRRAASDGAFPSKGAEKPNPVKVEVVSSDDSEAGNSASSDKECSVEESYKVEVPDQVWYVNTSSGVLHLLASPDDVPMLLACGRPVSGKYREATRAEVSRGKDRESLRALADHGIDTLSKLAYSCGQPGTPLPQSEFDDFISTVMPAALLGEKGSVKRLLFESQALLLNDLREQVTQPDKWSTRDVPTVERQKRMEAVRVSIPGVVLEGSLEPSHGLLSAACRMEREGQLRYIAPEQCGTRMYEIQNVKAQSKVLSLEEGKLAISEEKGLPEVACGSALLLQEALKRRGVALQFAGVASYVAHERYVLKLLGHMGREPPPGYARTSVHQLLTADRQVWTRMIENEISPKRSADGTYPVDRALLPTLESFDVTVALLPRKSEESKKRVATPHKPGIERDPKIAKPPKGKGKGKKGTWQPSVPEAIRKLGGVAETPDKKRICFSRNLPCGCTQDPCPKGLHVCALCSAPDHGLQECPKRKNGAAVTSVTSTSAGGQDSPMPDSIQLDTPGTISVEPVHPAEQFCSQLREGKLADVLQLITLLESETPARGQEAPNTFSWTSGAYAKGPLKGVRKHTSVFPACTHLLCKLVLQTFPDADFTAVAIYKNLQTALHVDVNNELGSQNYLIPITAFQGGEVWQKGPGNDIVQDELGFSLSGSLVRVADGPCTLNPRETHCTMPWTGDRVLLVAFKPNHAVNLSPEYRRRLLEAGFPESAFDSASCSQGRDSTCPRGVVPAHLDELPSKHCDNSACITDAVLVREWPTFLGPPPTSQHAPTVTLPYRRLVCLKSRGGLDLFKRVLALPNGRVPLTLGVPAPNASRPITHTGAIFSVETDIILLFLQACRVSAWENLFDPAQADSVSWPFHRQELQAAREKLQSSGSTRQAGRTWEVPRNEIAQFYLDAANIRGRTNRTSLNILGCPGASKTFSLLLAVMCMDAVVDFPVVWTSQQHAALLAVLMISHNVLADAPLWLRRMLIVRRVSGKQDFFSPVHDHVPLAASSWSGTSGPQSGWAARGVRGCLFRDALAERVCDVRFGDRICRVPYAALLRVRDRACFPSHGVAEGDIAAAVAPAEHLGPCGTLTYMANLAALGARLKMARNTYQAEGLETINGVAFNLGLVSSARLLTEVYGQCSQGNDGEETSCRAALLSSSKVDALPYGPVGDCRSGLWGRLVRAASP
ncbi:unnamed protein product [Symbiodinium sp. CCMP2592]|nr:unnamed protein product [Symbiodinium sp. CCMP2592]